MSSLAPMTQPTFSILSNTEYPWSLLLLADPSRAHINRYIHDSLVIGLLHDGVTLGVVVLKNLTDSSAEIMNLAVDERHQGKGLGKSLLSESFKECARRGIRTIEIGTGNSSLSQLYLYQKMGFRIVGVLKDHFTENYPEPIIENGIPCVDMIRLRREL